MSQANGKPTGIPDSDAETQFAAEAMTNGRYNDTYVQSQVERRNGNRAVSRRNRRGHLCENHTGRKFHESKGMDGRCVPIVWGNRG